MTGSRYAARTALMMTGVVLISVGGCATSGSGANLAFEASPASRAVLFVENHNWHDVRVYLVPDNGSLPVPLATVTSMTSTAVPLRQHQPNGSVRLLVRLIGSREEYVTESVLVERSAVMRMTVRNSLGLTSVYASGH